MNINIILYSFFRSSASWRVRTILNLKNIPYTQKPINIIKKEHNTLEYMDMNPMGVVPTLIVDGTAISESIAIAEYIEERFPDKRPLLPRDIKERAKVREICEHINSGMQPLQNMKVLNYVKSEFAGDTKGWALHWNQIGFKALEQILTNNNDIYSVGNTVTLADTFLLPQFCGAIQRFGLNPSDYPHVNRTVERLKMIPEFVAAFPENQPDCPKDR